MSSNAAIQSSTAPSKYAALQSDAELQLFYKVANAQILGFPYPHIYIPDIFPTDFYNALQQNMPDPNAMIPIEQARPVRGYKERFVLEMSERHLTTLPQEKQDFWQGFANWLLAGQFMQLVLAKFGPFVEDRFKGAKMDFYNEGLLVEDVTKYALGPHTDSPKKVITMLFYLPKDDSQSHLGTSIYLPKDAEFRCAGGPHHKYDGFLKLATMPFKPNSMFAFVKGDNSFHGVEPVTDPDTKRWLLLYDVYTKFPQVQPV